MPSAKVYEFQVEKEQKWLPFLAPYLPLFIPMPLAMGEPDENYPLKWSIYRWLEGETLSSSNITNLKDIAISLADFLTAFHQIDSTDGPPPELKNIILGKKRPEIIYCISLFLLGDLADRYGQKRII